MPIKVPKLCPWCEAEIIERTGSEQTALLGRRVYACGTIISLYGVMMQVTSPDAHPQESGWRPYAS
jgi:hypothetical protein